MSASANRGRRDDQGKEDGKQRYAWHEHKQFYGGAFSDRARDHRSSTQILRSSRSLLRLKGHYKPSRMQRSEDEYQKASVADQYASARRRVAGDLCRKRPSCFITAKCADT